MHTYTPYQVGKSNGKKPFLNKWSVFSAAACVIAIVYANAVFNSMKKRQTIPGIDTAAIAADKTVGNPIGGKIEFKTLATHPHATDAYTQGLVFHEGTLYESTGQYEKSSIRNVDISTGKPLKKTSLRPNYFGEGIELIGDDLYMLTWRAGECFVFDRETLKYKKTYKYSGEGWGLAFDGTHLILSDGTSTLRFYDPNDFSLKKRVTVYDGESLKRGRKIANLNELEMVEGELWANVWHSDRIARIDPNTGKISAWINCTSFVPAEIKQKRATDQNFAEKVLNGIAYDPKTKRIFITGKEWPVLYEIQLNFDR